MKRLQARQRMWLVVLTICIVLIGVNGIQLHFFPTIVPDEVGYWTSAAYLNGLDWSGTMADAPSYGIGYGILLAPLFLLQDPILMYRAAIGMNVLMLVGIFYLARAIAQKFFPKIPSFTVDLICFVITIYPYNSFYAKYTMSEVVATFVFWLLFYQLIRMFKRPNVWQAIFLAITAVYLYMIHLRMLGVLIALVITLLFALFRHKIKGKHFVVFLGVFAALFLVSNVYRNQVIASQYTQKETTSASTTAMSEILDTSASETDESEDESVMEEEEKVDINSLSAQFEKILKLFTLQGISNFFLGIFGRFFYWGAGSFLISYFGLIFLFGKLRALFCKKSVPATNSSSSLSFSASTEIAMFLLMAAFFSQAISSLSMIDPARIDTVMYGRYADFMVGPILLFGLIYVLYGKREHRTLQYGISCLLQGGIAFWLYFTIQKTQVSAVSGNSIVAIWGFPELDGMSQQLFFTFYACLCGLVGAQILFLINRRTQKARTVFLIVLSAFWILVGVNTIYKEEQSLPEIEKVLEAVDTVEQVTDDNGVIWYWCNNNENQMSYYRMYAMQYMFGKHQVKKLVEEDLANVGDHDVVIAYNTLEVSKAIGTWAGDNAVYLKGYNIYCRSKSLEGIQNTIKTVSLLSQGMADGCQLQEKQKDGSWETVYTQGADSAEVRQSLDSDGIYSIVTNTGIPLVEEKQEQDQLLLQEQEDGVAVLEEEEEQEEEETQENSNLGAAQYSVFGPSITLQPGTYSATFTLECLNLADCTSDSLGQCDISTDNGQNILASFPIDKSIFEDGGSKALMLEFSSAVGSPLSTVEFRVYTNDYVQLRVSDISYQYIGPQVKVLLPDTDDYNVVRNLVDLDAEFLPIYIVSESELQEQLDYSDLESMVDSKGHSVSFVSTDNLSGNENAFLMVPTAEEDLIRSLLPEYTILARLRNYAMLVPSGSEVCAHFRENGGRVLSNGTAIGLRYYAGTVANNASNIQATFPEGEYQISYEISIPGASLFDSCGTFGIYYGEDSVVFPLTKDLFEYDVFRGTETLVLEENTKISAQVTTLPEVSGAQLDVWVTPLS